MKFNSVQFNKCQYIYYIFLFKICSYFCRIEIYGKKREKEREIETVNRNRKLLRITKILRLNNKNQIMLSTFFIILLKSHGHIAG